ncbi:MAG: type III-A CRISPR-associated RAMP protein Csm4 [Peptostreptococcaceae bacterium]|nr:type III-A CRISPR-associated RAMP protein Csm4 [Peptostreptococcaceae bacterium]
MIPIIYKLQLPNGIHIGGLSGIGPESTEFTMTSDALYSAIFCEYKKLYDDDELYTLAENGVFTLSDLLPYKNQELYIPKPVVSIERKTQPSSELRTDRKKLKSMNHIPLSKLPGYFAFLRTGENLPEIDDAFGEKMLHTKNMISRTGEDTRLYNLEIFRFHKGSGLYFILHCPENFQKKFDRTLDSLSLAGLGGKRSLGYGRFDIVDRIVLENRSNDPCEKQLIEMLDTGQSTHYLLLSSYLPQKDEVEMLKKDQNRYRLIKRSGFVDLASYSDEPQKRKQLHMICSGSVLNFRPKGRIADLRLHGAHSIYRFGKPMILGVDLNG